MNTKDIILQVRGAKDTKNASQVLPKGQVIGSANSQQPQTKEEVIGAYTNQIKEKIDHMFDPVNGMDEKDAEQYENKILNKIHSGKKLTAEELRYVRIHMPELYPFVLKIQVQREALETRLEHCHSKEEVQKAYEDAMSLLSSDQPYVQETIAAYEDAMKEFKKTDAYKALPATEEEAKKHKQSVKEGKETQKDGQKELESYKSSIYYENATEATPYDSDYTIAQDTAILELQG